MWFAVFLACCLGSWGEGGAVGIYFSYCAAVVGTVLMYTMVGTKHQKNLEFSENFDFEKRWSGPLITNLDPLNGHKIIIGHPW